MTWHDYCIYKLKLNVTKTMKNVKTSGCLFAVTLGLLLASGAAQAGNKQAANQYADSVYSWGSWELGVEPAAGGPVPPPNNVVDNRPANIHFRPNDNTVYGLDKRNAASTFHNPTPAPTHTPPTMTPGITTSSSSPGNRF